ncbi:MAG: hypothetical protein CO090_06505 [Acidobacteria bacterium CG_4_9_14_3_um_filter_49_7]|nr:MAG: hypothetical protein CO090_06505 [Acidobacteria bacterium CG_4_9_14_3_um_filter_49_7]
MAIKKITNNLKIKEMSQAWGVFEVDEEHVYYWKIGDCCLWIKKEGKEVFIASFYAAQNGKLNSSVIPESASWTRYILKKKVTSIELSPVFPDRSIVVKPEVPFYLTENTGRNVYIRVPVFISVHALANSKLHLCELPSVVLSKTWYGDLKRGELCYWLSSSAKPQIEPDIERPYMSICSLRLVNKSKENLLIAKLAVRVLNSSLFMHESQLWSDLITITFSGENEISELIFSGKPNNTLKGSTKICDPRQKQRKNVLIQSFESATDIRAYEIFVKK